MTLSQLIFPNQSPPVISAALRALRTICISVGYLPRPANQSAICRTFGLRNIVSLALSQSTSPGGSTVDNDIIRMDAMLTLAAVQLSE